MKTIKKTPEYTIYQKRSERYAVQDADKKWVNGDEKIKILVTEKLLKIEIPKPKPAEKAPAKDDEKKEGETAE